jgi:hypothetical protein
MQATCMVLLTKIFSPRKGCACMKNRLHLVALASAISKVTGPPELEGKSDMLFVVVIT